MVSVPFAVRILPLLLLCAAIVQKVAIHRVRRALLPTVFNHFVNQKTQAHAVCNHHIHAKMIHNLRRIWKQKCRHGKQRTMKNVIVLLGITIELVFNKLLRVLSRTVRQVDTANRIRLSSLRQPLPPIFCENNLHRCLFLNDSIKCFFHHRNRLFTSEFIQNSRSVLALLSAYVVRSLYFCKRICLFRLWFHTCCPSYFFAPTAIANKKI